MGSLQKRALTRIWVLGSAIVIIGVISVGALVVADAFLTELRDPSVLSECVITKYLIPGFVFVFLLFTLIVAIVAHINWYRDESKCPQ